MKRFVLTLTVVLLSCLKSSATPYTIPITGSGTYNFLGSQFIVGETVTSYSTSPQVGDSIIFWDVLSQNFDATTPTYTPMGWDQNSLLPLGTLSHSAFWYVDNGSDTTFNRNITPVTPAALPARLPNLWYALSSQTPVNAQYGDLVGVPGTDTPPGLSGGTYVMRWDITTFDFQTVWRFGPASQWWRYANGTVTPYTGPWMIPQFEGAFVGRFTAPCSPSPSLQSVVVSGCCAPIVTLTLTFLGDVDPVTAGIPSSYTIGPAGQVTGVTVQAGTMQISGSPLLMPSAISVVLTVKLMTQCGNTYTVSAPGVKCIGGTAVTGTLNFSLTGCGIVPANDTAGTASLLTSGVTVNGSLKLANCTPSSAVSTFPTGAGANAKDVWYTYTTTPGSSGLATIDTCYTLPSGCPQSDLVIAVYRMSGSILVPIPGGSWFSSPVTCLNPKGVQVQFNSQACKTYYIRVSGKATGTLPGDFALQLTAPNAAPLNNACLSAITVGPNSSTPFNTTLATTDGPGTEPVFNDVWYSFQGLAGAGAPYATTVEICNSTFNQSLAVYAVGGPCPGTVVTLSAATAGAGCASAKAFLANAGQQYLIRVGGLTASDKGCGILHLTSAIPSAGTGPAVGNPLCKKYRIQGLPTGVGWTWQLTAPAVSGGCSGFNVTDTVGAYTPAPLTAFHLASVFAASINTHAGFNATAVNIGNSGVADLKICSPCPASSVVLYVNGCPVNSSGSCSFNPDISDLDDSENQDLDCNGNGQSDYLDILDGTSSDVDGNGVPDECQICVGAAVAGGPDSTGGGVGGNATFSAQAVGTGPFSYQWNKGGTPLSGQTNATLLLTNLTLNSADLYDVTVSNTCSGVTSPAAVLYVDPLPVVNITKVGSNVVLSWSDPGYHLQANPVLNNPVGWADITNASPVTVPLTNATRFFRLQQEP